MPDAVTLRWLGDGLDAELGKLALGVELFTAALNMWFNVVTSARGRAFGPQRPYREVWSKPGKPTSAIVGMSGARRVRLADVTARPTIFFSASCGRSPHHDSQAPDMALFLDSDARVFFIAFAVFIRAVRPTSRRKNSRILAPASSAFEPRYEQRFLGGRIEVLDELAFAVV
jgi:hypothetical protein